jgi:DNA-binding IclR family transcriptional regulator
VTADPKRPSPPTDRVLAILDLLMREPAHERSLGQIVDELGMSRATAHAIVRTLLDAGYLARLPESKGYTLGPALVAAGRAAELSYPAVQVARPLLPALARRFDAECTAAIVDGEAIAVVEWATPPDRIPSGRVGQRIPLLPPFGAIQVAWASDAEADAWIDRSPHLTASARGQLQEALGTIRRRGFDVQRGDRAAIRLHEALGTLEPDSLSDRQREAVEVVMAELAEAAPLPVRLGRTTEYDVHLVSAVAFDASARPALTLSLLLHRTMTGGEIDRAARELVAVADRTTIATGGRRPPPRRTG